MEGFPERLIKIRKKRGLLQKELAEKIGVKPTRLNTWEGGTREPNLEMFRRIVAALKVNPNYLLCLSDNPEAENDDTFDKYVHGGCAIIKSHFPTSCLTPSIVTTHPPPQCGYRIA